MHGLLLTLDDVGGGDDRRADGRCSGDGLSGRAWLGVRQCGMTACCTPPPPTPDAPATYPHSQAFYLLPHICTRIYVAYLPANTCTVALVPN